MAICSWTPMFSSNVEAVTVEYEHALSGLGEECPCCLGKGWPSIR